MKRLILFLLLAASLSAAPPPRRPENVSLRHEVELAMDRGLGWLTAHQHPGGAWGAPQRPALTALALVAFFRQPRETDGPQPRPEFIERGLVFLRTQAEPDGGIHAGTDALRQTALALQALLHARDPADEPLTKRAAAFLAACQVISPSDPQQNGGFSPNSRGSLPGTAPTVTITCIALEALRTYQQAHPRAAPAPPPYDPAAAIAFLTRCQIPDAGELVQNRGAFLDQASAGQRGPPCGDTTCAGLLALLYSGVPASDSRVTAALEWLRHCYTLEKNPGCEGKDYHEYLHLLAKALSTLGIEELHRPGQAPIDWPRELALKLVNTQTSAGTWANPNSSEDPIATTIQALLTLQIAHAQL
jgi:squalene-hopene/tetraprenyl-beta-curcumene cyclase